MEKEFCVGLVLGMLGGALIVANSNKTRKFITDSQTEIKKKVEDFENDGKQTSKK